MAHKLIGAALAAAMLASTPAYAWDGRGGGGWHGDGGWHGGGGNWVLPFVGGAIVGGALGAAPYYANPYPYSGYPYGYGNGGYSQPYYPPQPRWCQGDSGQWYQC